MTIWIGSSGSRQPRTYGRRLIRRRLLLLVGLMCAIAAISGPALAYNVKTITRVAVRLLPDGTSQAPVDTVELDLDFDNPPEKARAFSIPPGRIAEFIIEGIAEATDVAALGLGDDDSQDGVGADDEMDETQTPVNVPAGSTFLLRLYCHCDPSSKQIDGLEPTGEQNAEAFVVDGAARAPADHIGPGGKKVKSWWKLDCDKQTTGTVSPSGGRVAGVWGDTLVIPPGALPAPTTITMANAYPLPNPEAVPPGSLPVSEALTIEPAGRPLAAPAQVVFSYQHEEAGETADERTLAAYRYDPGLLQWLPVPGATVDVPSRRFTIPILEFGTYGFAAARPVWPLLAAQVVQTTLGDSQTGLEDLADGSELDFAKAIVDERMVHLWLGGNLRADLHKLEVFIDCLPGGQNFLRGDNVVVDGDALNRMGDDGRGGALRFDPGFEPDYWIGLGGVTTGLGQYRLRAQFASLPTAGQGAGGYLGEVAPGNAFLYGGSNPGRVRVWIDNSNTAGVTAGCGPSSPAGDSTGIHLAIPLAALGNPVGCIRVCAFLNSSDHGFVSNQFLPSLGPGTCDLGDPRRVDLLLHPGPQFFEVCPFAVTGVTNPPGTLPARLSSWPNPFRDHVSVRLARAPSVSARVEIFDLVGRRVRTLPSSAFRSGVGTWDGRSNDGRLVSAGLYVLRVADVGSESHVFMLRIR